MLLGLFLFDEILSIVSSPFKDLEVLFLKLALTLSLLSGSLLFESYHLIILRSKILFDFLLAISFGLLL